MNKVPTIKGSAQARLLLYRLFSLKLTEAEQRLLQSDPTLWERILYELETIIDSDGQKKSNEAVLQQAFATIDKTTREGLQRQMERLVGQSFWLGVHATGLLDAFVDEHQKLIKSVQREYIDKIGLAIKRGIREGRLQKDIARDIRNHTNISKRRSQHIARNAPLQYSGALTKHNQMSAGIKSYIWQSSRDERVRDSHRKYDGEIFNWDGPGPHPRNEVNCRCDAVPLVI
jgi:SPP1 gp7 family putative phage head morphogenesis protein